VSDPEHLDGLRRAVAAAIDYGLSGIEDGGNGQPPLVPASLLIQARIAARNGIGLDTVLRRYFAGYAVLGDFLLAATQESGLARDPALKRMLRAQATRFDHLLAAVSEEHARGTQSGPPGIEERQVERIERLLGGELIDTSEIAYDFQASHLGMVAKGRGAHDAVRELTNGLDCRLLAIERSDVVWAWLGARRPIDAECLRTQIGSAAPAQVSFALGESASGLRGWRLTHRQAKAALPIALRSPEGIARYGEVALLASVLQDALLTASLRELYLVPLEGDRDKTALGTLSAYFSAECNVSSTAAALGVSRQTIRNRFQAIEERLGRPLDSCTVELQLALRLEEFERQRVPNRQVSPSLPLAD
jgi:hypothetical protein